MKNLVPIEYQECLIYLKNEATKMGCKLVNVSNYETKSFMVKRIEVWAYVGKGIEDSFLLEVFQNNSVVVYKNIPQ